MISQHLSAEPVTEKSILDLHFRLMATDQRLGSGSIGEKLHRKTWRQGEKEVRRRPLNICSLACSKQMKKQSVPFPIHPSSSSCPGLCSIVWFVFHLWSRLILLFFPISICIESSLIPRVSDIFPTPSRTSDPDTELTCLYHLDWMKLQCELYSTH